MDETSNLERAIARFEDVIGRRHRGFLDAMRPGLSDAELDRLREAVSPYLVPRQVMTLYRWRDGGDSGLFGGWHMLPLDRLLDFYVMYYDDLGAPRTWLPVFDDQIINVVTLDVPGQPRSDPSVWYGHTHDGTVDRLFDSIAALMDTVCDAAADDALLERNGRLGLPRDGGIESVDGRTWTNYRLRRSPGAARHPDPPPGTHLSREPAQDWPPAWLAAIGVTQESLRPRGATHTVSGLLRAAVPGPVRGTVRGRVVADFLWKGSRHPASTTAPARSSSRVIPVGSPSAPT